MKWMFKNPMSLWLKYTLKNKLLENKYKSKYLKIDYMCQVNNSTFGFYNRVFENCILNDVVLGDLSFIAKNTKIARTTIGKYCSIGPDCRIGMANHPSKTFVSSHPAFYSNGKQFQITFADKDYFHEFDNIEIGNDVWIGSNVIIVGNIKIGNGAIVAAGAVVNKDIPDYSIVGGVPAKHIRYRFKKDEIDFLLKDKWWDKEMTWLQSNYKEFHNIADFIKFEGIK